MMHFWITTAQWAGVLVNAASGTVESGKIDAGYDSKPYDALRRFMVQADQNSPP